MADLSYPETGGTLAGALPVGYHHLAVERRLGGPERYDAAVTFVLGWGLHRGAGLRVPADLPRATEGDRVVLRLGVGRLALSIPVQVVGVLDEPDRGGFAYGTLRGHPECGEELVAVERRPDGTWLVIRAFSRPGRWFTRVVGPVGRAIQRLMTRRYLDAASRAVAQTGVR
ncbi:DUF1990 domain-containing protein [Nocardioides sp. W7]|uniref:DUF1990 family protein n=1 Tax=Nocardioides sp. W7 TaxID=2931390 RepID=UPI001FD226DF|nr:DUF1990 domain-containing protein [Nocardioides sp. W7]